MTMHIFYDLLVLCNLLSTETAFTQLLIQEGSCEVRTGGKTYNLNQADNMLVRKGQQ